MPTSEVIEYPHPPQAFMGHPPNPAQMAEEYADWAKDFKWGEQPETPEIPNKDIRAFIAKRNERDEVKRLEEAKK